MKLSPTQLRVLRYACEGRLIWRHDVGWFQKGGYEIATLPGTRPAERDPSVVTVRKLLDLGLVRFPSADSRAARTIGVVTPKGAALLDEQGER